MRANNLVLRQSYQKMVGIKKYYLYSLEKMLNNHSAKANKKIYN